ncbi:hypothetical protein CBM2634_B160062 [Cupriavidus taiwanensis]|uniref:Uncharacterized protein n=1 Tax=Cupriavidus taiwanensis TaxID=164546 RepID=A0A375J9B0_9BURK|nr:hypothetical protein CBM2634_B160062 [Cupriavidus taiwanensis]
MPAACNVANIPAQTRLSRKSMHSSLAMQIQQIPNNFIQQIHPAITHSSSDN